MQHADVGSFLAGDDFQACHTNCHWIGDIVVTYCYRTKHNQIIKKKEEEEKMSTRYEEEDL